MTELGIADQREKGRQTSHLMVAIGLLGFNFIVLMLADSMRPDGFTAMAVILVILCLGVIVAGYGINLVEDRCTKPRPIQCPSCRAILPNTAKWKCGYCEATNSGSPLEKCKRCGYHLHAIKCCKQECQHVILLRAPLGNDPIATYVHDDQSDDQYAEKIQSHQRQKKIIEQDKELTEAQVDLLKAQEKAARAEQALARARETPEETYEREVLAQLQSEGKRREVMKKLRDEIEQEADMDERKWKTGVLDKIERKSLDL